MFKSILVGAALVAAPAAVQAADISATGSGWCSVSYGCDSNGNYINNNFAGDAGEEFRDFFTVAIPLGTISSASLSIWNDGSNYNTDPAAVYTLRAATGISFGGLASGDTLGSVLLSDADTGVGHFVTIDLNAAGIAALNAAAGSTFLFGGVVTYSQHAEFAGYTGGYPAAYLSLTQSGAVPEPASWALMLGGFGLVGSAMRRRRRAAVSFA
jgi:hypothetical protein